MAGMNYFNNELSNVQKFDNADNAAIAADRANALKAKTNEQNRVQGIADTAGSTQSTWGRQGGPTIPAYLGNQVTNEANKAITKNDAFGKYAAKGYLGTYEPPLEQANTDLLQQADRVAASQFVPNPNIPNDVYKSNFAPQYQAPELPQYQASGLPGQQTTGQQTTGQPDYVGLGNKSGY